MVSRPAAAAHKQARQADGKFGAQIHSESHGVVLVPPSIANRTREKFDNGEDPVCIFDHDGSSVAVGHRGGDNYSLYNESTNDHLADFQFSGNPEDHSKLEDEAVRILREQQDNEAVEPDLSLFFEEDRALPRALYRAGLKGTLEPFNGDYPINNGALRYWNEDLNRELVVGTAADGTTVVALDAELSDPVRISVSLGSDPSPEEITAAIRDVSGQVQRANLPDLDEE